MRIIVVRTSCGADVIFMEILSVIVGILRRILYGCYTYDRIMLTFVSRLSKSFAISSSDGRPPAVTSSASVKVQYDSLLLAGVVMVENEDAPYSNSQDAMMLVSEKGCGLCRENQVSTCGS